MTIEELNEWAEEFETFQARFAHIFGRKEPPAGPKVRPGVCWPRLNAKIVGNWPRWWVTSDPTQRLLDRSHWDADAARDELEAYVSEVFGAAEGMGGVDETGFIKKGQPSVGVKRPSSGTAGKIENSQVGTFLS